MRSRKSVSLTLWGKHAEETGGALEGMESPIVSVSSVRVTDYNGDHHSPAELFIRLGVINVHPCVQVCQCHRCRRAL